MTKQEKRDENIARLCFIILIIYGIYRLTTISPDIRKAVWIVALIMPRYYWILLLPIIILVVSISMRIIWFVLWGKLFEDN